MPPLKIGTRGSPLALAQAHETRDRLMAAHGLPETAFEIVVIKTTGDDAALIAADKALKELGGKGLFTREIEEALLDGGIDIAVHSMKDMPTLQPEGLVLDCYLKRAVGHAHDRLAPDADHLALGQTRRHIVLLQRQLLQALQQAGLGAEQRGLRGRGGDGARCHEGPLCSSWRSRQNNSFPVGANA